MSFFSWAWDWVTQSANWHGSGSIPQQFVAHRGPAADAHPEVERQVQETARHREGDEPPPPVSRKRFLTQPQHTP